jgi:hypothetical protein
MYPFSRPRRSIGSCELLRLREIWLRSIYSEFIEMLVEGATLEFGEVERNRLGIIGVLSQQFMSTEMVLREVYQLLRGRSGAIWEDLRVDMAG